MTGGRVFIIQREGWFYRNNIELIKSALAEEDISVKEVISADVAVKKARSVKSPRPIFVVFVSRAGIRKAKTIKRKNPRYNVVVFTGLVIPEEKRKGVIIHKLDDVVDVKRAIRC